VITLATSEELPAVADLAKWYFYKCGSIGEFDAGSFVTAWTDLLRSGAGYITKRTNGNPEPQEAMGVLIYPDPNRGQRVAAATFWYAQDDSSMASGLLHERTLREARERGAVGFYSTALINERYGKVSGFFLGSGYKPVEVHFYKEL